MAEKLRNMTAVYLFREGKLLMLYRVGSRVVAPSWCGVGGHFEQAELNDPRACALRELREETGLTEESLEELRLRYITLRMKNGEIRQNYYFFAGLKPGAAVRGTCDEGRLEWVPYDSVLKREMPFTAKTGASMGASPKRRTVHLRSLRSFKPRRRLSPAHAQDIAPMGQKGPDLWRRFFFV